MGEEVERSIYIGIAHLLASPVGRGKTHLDVSQKENNAGN